MFVLDAIAVTLWAVIAIALVGVLVGKFIKAGGSTE
jgi:hypothetical protein